MHVICIYGPDLKNENASWLLKGSNERDCIYFFFFKIQTLKKNLESEINFDSGHK